MKKIAVLMGSLSDQAVADKALGVLDSYGVPCSVRVCSAHRTPGATASFARSAEGEGFGAIICIAGMAAHLAGAVAANTTLPVVGVPVASGGLGGMDALLATVQMPTGFPVATVALDKAGARNAAWLAAQILALNDAALAERLQAAREKFREDVEKAGAELMQKHNAQ